MADTFDMLTEVKQAIGLTGTYQDNTIQQWINEAEQYMLDAGVDESLVNAKVSVGTVARGVLDLWNYGAGDGELSPYFKERVIQLSMKTPDQIAKAGGVDNG